VNDRFLRACRREPTDTTPIWFMRQAGRSLPEYRAIRAKATLEEIVADPALCADVTLQPVRRLGVDAAILFADITTPLAGIGVHVRLVDGVGPIIDAPITSPAGVGALRPFEPEVAVGSLLDAIRLLRRELTVPLIGFAGAPFTLASYLVAGRASRDAGALKRLMHRNPALAEALFTRLADMTIAYLGAQIAAGAQAVQLFDSWAGALSPDEYASHVAPHVRRIFDALADWRVPLIHFSTGTSGMLGEVAAAGGDVIGVDWRIRLDDAWRSIGNRAIQGNLDPDLLLGPWTGTRDGADAVLRQAAGRPGHVFNLGHGVPPAADRADLARLVDLVHEAGARRAAA
jgi:uroporphyrinogen decarboxylase